jgi:1-acyl-sn-glycerol-3-phosphate acyltransferase
MSAFVESLKHTRIVKSFVYAIVGAVTYPGFAIINSIAINGADKLKDLPRKNVLFVSNHQTYFADVIMFLHIFCAVKWRKYHRLGLPFYLLNPFTRVHYVAAEETMKGSLIGRIFSMAGAITVKRTWRAEGKDVNRERDSTDTARIDEALTKSWVITFPQGTTKPFAPGRKGTAHIIKNNNPIVIPVVIRGFWRAFNKKGLRFKKKGSLLSVTFKDPLQFKQEDSVEYIMDTVMDAIEQSKKFMLKGKHHLLGLMDK